MARLYMALHRYVHGNMWLMVAYQWWPYRGSGWGGGGSPCRMSIIRNAHVALSILRIDKGSRCVLRCTSILLITYLYCYKVVDYVKEMLVYELSDDIHHNKKCIGNSLK